MIVALYAGGAVILFVLAMLSRGVIVFLRDRRLADLSWSSFVPDKIADLGSVRTLSITPLIDWYVNDPMLTGEAGVSWLVKADETTILMDVGLNRKDEDPSPLLRNMQALDVSLKDIRTVFISHLHLDHVGGLPSLRSGTFTLSRSANDLSHIVAYVPTRMTHPTAQVKLVERPEVLVPGIASEGPIARSLFGLGMTMEQALVVNLSGKGLVIVVGCGHQGLARILERADQLFDEPLYALVAGLHFPVTRSRLTQLGIPMQKYLGTGKLPWQRVAEQDVEDAILLLQAKKPRLVSISAHDSCDWTVRRFREVFGERYRELKVGLPLTF